jgi:hypothetical protein
MASASFMDPLADNSMLGQSTRPRGARTLTLLLIGRIIGEGSDGLCRIRNISLAGLMAEVCGVFATGQRVRVEFRNGHIMAGVIRWTRNDSLGIKFDEPLDDIKQVLSEAPPEPDQAHIWLARSPRFLTNCSAHVHLGGQSHRACVINVSQGGARLITTVPVTRGQLLTLAITGLPPLRAIVRWTAKDGAGVSFFAPPAFAALGKWLDIPALRYNQR